MKRLLTVAIVSTLFLLSGCASNSAKAPAGAMNAKCPMSGEALDGKGPTVDFNGAKVAFCCDKCAASFAKLSDAEKQAKVTAVK